LRIRKETAEANEKAKEYLATAQADYNFLINEATAKAGEILSQANNRAAILVAEVEAEKSALAIHVADVASHAKEIDLREAKLSKLSASFEAKQNELDAALLAARKAREEAIQIKEAFLAKQKAFLESI